MQPHRSNLPSTFEERGTAVSFTTPLLTGCRIRKDYKGRLEVMVPSLADSKGTYVIPWGSLGEIVSLTLHDRMLYSEITTSPSIGPRDIRTAVLKIAATGLAGPQAAEGANRARTDEERAKTLTNYMLVARIVALKGKRPEEIMSIIGTLEGRRLVRSYLNEIANQFGTSPAELDRQIEQLSEIASPIGLPGASPSTGLRLQLEELAGFCESMRSWSNSAAPEHAGLARICADVAEHTHALGMRALAHFDAKLARIEKIVSNFDVETFDLPQMIEKLFWLLDGWQFLIDWWKTAREQARYEQIVALTGVFRILPFVPAAELKQKPAESGAMANAAQNKFIKIFENWKTGDVDNELVSRMEAIKAKSA